MANRTRIIFLSMVLALICVGVGLASYLNAKKAAVTLIGPSMAYVKLSKVRFYYITIRGKKRPDWLFEFRNPAEMDLNFDVFVSVLGKVVFTNPTDLAKRLRRLEKLPVYPYPKIHRD